MIALLALTLMPLLLVGMGIVCYALGHRAGFERGRDATITRFRQITEPLVFIDKRSWAFIVSIMRERGVEIVEGSWNGDDDGAVERLLAEARRNEQS